MLLNGVLEFADFEGQSYEFIDNDKQYTLYYKLKDVPSHGTISAANILPLRVVPNTPGEKETTLIDLSQITTELLDTIARSLNDKNNDLSQTNDDKYPVTGMNLSQNAGSMPHYDGNRADV
jgi:hypothetical protein